MVVRHGPRMTGGPPDAQEWPSVHMAAQAAILRFSASNRENRLMGQLRGGIVPVTGFQQNCTILWDDDSKHGVVTDPGGDVDRILSAVEQAGVSVGQIWLTHGHLDHAGGAAE